MLWAAATLCFFGFLHAGEAVAPSDTGYDSHFHLSFGDVRVDSIQKPSWLAVDIKRSKTDQFGKGVTLSIGATGTDICPVAAMLGYLARRGSNPGPLFLFHDPGPLRKPRKGSTGRGWLQPVPLRRT